MSKIYDIAVIGAGAAGCMGALRSVLNNKDTIVFTGDKDTKRKARDTWVSTVVNMPLMFDLKKPILNSTKETFGWIKSQEHFADKFTEIKSKVKVLSKEEDIFTLEIDDPKSDTQKFQARYVLLATGIMDVQPIISGTIKPILGFANAGLVDYCLRCDGHKTLGKVSAVIGHKAVAAWVATILHERYNPPEMKIFTNGEQEEFDEELQKIIDLYNIKIIRDKITNVVGDLPKTMEGFVMEDDRTEKVEIAFVALGQIAYNDLAKQVGAKINKKGNVVCNEKGESTVPGLYVAGDLRSGKKYQIYTAWDMAVDSIDDIDHKIRSHRRMALIKCKYEEECEEEILAETN